MVRRISSRDQSPEPLGDGAVLGRVQLGGDLEVEPASRPAEEFRLSSCLPLSLDRPKRRLEPLRLEVDLLKSVLAHQ